MVASRSTATRPPPAPGALSPASAQARSRAAARAPRTAFSARGRSAARVLTSRDATGSDATGPASCSCSRALLSDGQAAEDLYREAIDRLGRSRMRPAAARARLLYGEWMRRENHRRDARAELRTAHAEFTAMGAFAERARRELQATGDTVRKRTAETAATSPPRKPTSSV